jgi:hypothetical protein
MRRALAGLLLAVPLAACSSLTETAGGVGVVVVLVPSPAEIEVGQTIQLRAVALDGNQDTVDVPIVWRALDTTIIVDSTAGLLTGRTAGQTGRVIARAADLYSSEVKFTVVPVADTLVRVSADTQTVETTATLSGDLVVRLDGGDPPVPIAGRRVIYQVVEPLFGSVDDRTVEFQNSQLLVTGVTGQTGTPPGIKLRKRADKTPPDSAIVEVTAYRPAGGPPVPGSGTRFIIRFAKP